MPPPNEFVNAPTTLSVTLPALIPTVHNPSSYGYTIDMSSQGTFLGRAFETVSPIVCAAVWGTYGRRGQEEFENFRVGKAHRHSNV